MNKALKTKPDSMARVSRLFVAMSILAGSAVGASAQTMGSTLASFNVLGNSQVTLTGFSPVQPLIIPVVGTSPGVTLTLTNASAGVYHANDAAAVNGQTQGLALFNSLTAPAGATYIPLGGTLPPVLNPGPGITVYQAAAGVTTNTSAMTITAAVTAVVIFQIPTALSLTDVDIRLTGGIVPANIYWQVVQAVTVVNDDASNRNFPGTVVNNTGAQDIAITCSGAGSLGIGRLVSLGGKVVVTQSGAGVMTVATPAGVGSGFGGGPIGCTDGNFYPSPATGATGTFNYCMESQGDVKIRVYNAIGDLAVKVDDTKAAGPQFSTIDTGRLAPGVYMYILERTYVTGNKSRSKVKKFAVQH
ncbi:MAG: hypothetical protein ACHQ51_00720 [Elusimicrobiota bacterium]